MQLFTSTPFPPLCDKPERSRPQINDIQSFQQNASVLRAASIGPLSSFGISSLKQHALAIHSKSFDASLPRNAVRLFWSYFLDDFRWRWVCIFCSNKFLCAQFFYMRVSLRVGLVRKKKGCEQFCDLNVKTMHELWKFSSKFPLKGNQRRSLHILELCLIWKMRPSKPGFSFNHFENFH